MVVYYLQVIEQLPVLHRAIRADALVATAFDFQVQRSMFKAESPKQRC